MSRLAIDNETLKGIANAIRDKTGKSALMTASEMAGEISGIQAGGDDLIVNSIIDRSITNIESDMAVVGAYSFAMCSFLSRASFPKAAQIKAGAFIACESLKELYIPKAEELHDHALSGCGSLDKLDFENLTQINTQALAYTMSLTAIILRTPTVCTLNSADSFEFSGIELGNGFIYVPNSLVEEYKQASNWTAYADQIRAIEEYPDITGRKLS